ncbi:MAG: three-Cys-motif partner protein TcmP [Acidobacteria bacterium]|nr:three-Cys-motif partner protein TcmP [Acidobacteriota bacterium]
MSKYNTRILFVDGFAGPGKYSAGEEGSPLIALRTLLDHNHFREPKAGREFLFLFIEKEKDRADALRFELAKLATSQPIPKSVKWDVRNNEFALEMNKIMDYIEGKPGTVLAPAFLFIDPFGFSGVPMKTIARLAKNPKCESLITFMFESINRFLSDPKATTQAHLDELFGTPHWRELAKEKDPNLRQEGLVELYRKQLAGIAGFKFVRTFQMINEGNRTEYFLCFATNNRLGLSKIKESMWRADPEEGRTFSDRTALDPQLVLIQPTVDLTRLQYLLTQRFQSEGLVPIQAVKDFVLFDTPYSEMIHLKKKTLAAMERENPPLIRVERPLGKRIRRGEYPDGTRIDFL